MLVLSRRVGETIAIGDNIQVTILEVRGNSVRVGLTAPREVAIRRTELPLEPSSSRPASLQLATGERAPRRIPVCPSRAP